jgi:benzoyl-CoA reductase/2-hydroxyglutaryl-CoA dehydratase subunit BcrC/BadD/HgdB
MPFSNGNQSFVVLIIFILYIYISYDRMDYLQVEKPAKNYRSGGSRMATDYRPMWTDLGLNLEAHDALLNVLSLAYQDVYLSQKDRPEGMEYFDFVMSEVHGLRIKELQDAKATGRKVVGTFCVFVPDELILATDAISVGLCAGAEFGLEDAEKLLPRNTCSLIKSFFGFKLNRVCPYLEASDMIVGETTCDGKKKAYEIFKTIQPNVYVMEVPQMKNPQDRELLSFEYQRFKEELEKLTGVTITAERLKKGIVTVNNRRKALRRLATLRAADPAPVSGLDALLINQVAFYDDPVRFTNSVNIICNDLETRIKNREGVATNDSPRILISGCPMAVPNWKLPFIIESSGGIIVGEESCVGERGTQNLVSETGSTVEDMMQSIIDRYFQIQCAIFTPNPERTEHIQKMAKEYHADGVIHYSLQFCSPYTIESHSVEKVLTNNEVPFIRVETDYSQEDTGQLKTRIDAFLEILSK